MTKHPLNCAANDAVCFRGLGWMKLRIAARSATLFLLLSSAWQTSTKRHQGVAILLQMKGSLLWRLLIRRRSWLLAHLSARCTKCRPSFCSSAFPAPVGRYQGSTVSLQCFGQIALGIVSYQQGFTVMHAGNCVVREASQLWSLAHLPSNSLATTACTNARRIFSWLGRPIQRRAPTQKQTR